MNFPIGQHIVPKFILKNFTDKNGNLHCYNKPTDTTFPATPKNALRVRYFYTEVAQDGTPTNTAEERLGGIESDFRDLSVRLIDSAKNGHEIRLCKREIDQVREFILVQFRRSRRVNTLAQQVSDDTSKVKNEMASLIFESPLNPILDGAVGSTGIVLGTPEGSRKAFIIGDSPVALLSYEGGWKEITMPIASDVAITLSSMIDEPVLRRLNPCQVGAVNKEIAKFSDTIASHHAAYTDSFRSANFEGNDWPGA